MKQNNNLTI